MPKKTLNCIIEHECDFLVQLKCNRRKLWDTLRLETGLSYPLSTYEIYDNTRKEILYKRIEVFENITDKNFPKGWNNINTVIRISRFYKLLDGTINRSLAFYVCSLKELTAQAAYKATKGHWAVENKLHWIKDANMGEDDMSISHNTNAASLLAHFNSITLNTLTTAGYQPTKNNLAKFKNKVFAMSDLFIMAKKT